MKQASQKTSPTEYVPLAVMALFWGADAFIDAKLFSSDGSYHQTLLGGHAISLHLIIFLAQFVILLYVLRLVRSSARLRDSLEGVRRQADEDKARAESIMAAMVDPVSVQSTDFTILYQNQAHRDIFGDRSGEQCHRAYMGNETTCEGCHLVETFRSGIPQRREVSLLQELGMTHAEIVSSPMRDATGRVVAGIEVIRDITSRKRAEDKIRKLNADLEQRALDLAASYREVEAFSYSVSHDLRTPLTRIYSAGQALAEGGAGLDENGRFFAQTICDACEQMEELIEALISLARVTSTDMMCEEIDLVSLGREILAVLSVSQPGRKVEFVAPAELMVTGDRELLRVLLENLLGNSWKYTGKVPAASIELGTVATEKGVVYVVRDNGAGFDMKQADRLFKPFCRLHTREDFPGTGIGLATVQRIVHRHGGEVWAEGAVGKGASVYFTLKQQVGGCTPSA